MFNASALRSPNRMRLSTLQSSMVSVQHATRSGGSPLRPFAIDAQECLLAQGTRTDNSHGGDEFDVRFARSESLKPFHDTCRDHLFGRNSPVRIGTLGRYFEIKRAVFPLVDKTRIAPASCSEAAATAAIATVSTVSVGRGWIALRSSYKGG